MAQELEVFVLAKFSYDYQNRPHSVPLMCATYERIGPCRCSRASKIEPRADWFSIGECHVVYISGNITQAWCSPRPPETSKTTQIPNFPKHFLYIGTGYVRAEHA